MEWSQQHVDSDPNTVNSSETSSEYITSHYYKINQLIFKNR